MSSESAKAAIASTSTGAPNGSEATPSAERACLPSITEHLHKEIRGSVGDDVLLVKSRSAGDEHLKFQQANGIKVTARQTELRKQVEGASLRAQPSGIHVNICSEQTAGDHIAIIVPRELTRHEYDPVQLRNGKILCAWSNWRRECEPES